MQAVTTIGCCPDSTLFCSAVDRRTIIEHLGSQLDVPSGRNG
jgi:hypothetical protein